MNFVVIIAECSVLSAKQALKYVEIFRFDRIDNKINQYKTLILQTKLYVLLISLRFLFSAHFKIIKVMFNKTYVLRLLKSIHNKFKYRFSSCISVNPNKQMAKSRYEYVKNFESDQTLLPNTWIVVRIDGRAFHKFSQKHEFAKPNDERALNLMNRAAVVVMQEFKDIVISFGESDEYSFVFRKDTLLYNRREQKIMSYVNSLFSSAYVFHWTEYFKDTKLLYPPLFDARIVLYPTDTNLRDYLSWRQADVHVNNLYNTTFWTLIMKGGLTNRDAEKTLSGTFSADKNELLFSEFGINYNNEPVIYRKGTILMRKIIKNPMKSNSKPCQVIYPFHKDLIKNQFWDENSEILSCKGVKTFECDAETKLLPTLVLKQLPVSDKEGSEISDNK